MIREFLEELQQKTGAIPWFVNAGTGRFPFGLFFWKMTKHGVRGKVEWFYNLEATGGTIGLQTMCIGHGMATATIIERI